MSSLSSLTTLLATHKDLTDDQVATAAKTLADPGVPDADKAAFLTALSDKGETASEVAAFASAFREMSNDPGLQEWAPQAIDIVGTGGDHAGGFNVSSLVAITLSCAGVPAMKHGNRGITSKCGSADLMSALGVDLTATPEKLRHAMKDLGFVFLFAPNFHPAFKHIAPVRRQLASAGRRSVFNFIGPLINPARPAHALIGACSEAWASRLAAAFDRLGSNAGLSVYGIIGEGRGIDELTTATVNRVHGFGRLAAIDAKWRAEDFGLRNAPFSELVGGDMATNLALVEAIIDGRGPGGLVDSIVLNTATSLWITGRTAKVAEGLPLARELLVGGAVRAKIAATREFYRS